VVPSSPFEQKFDGRSAVTFPGAAHRMSPPCRLRCQRIQRKPGRLTRIIRKPRASVGELVSDFGERENCCHSNYRPVVIHRTIHSVNNLGRSPGTMPHNRSLLASAPVMRAHPAHCVPCCPPRPSTHPRLLPRGWRGSGRGRAEAAGRITDPLRTLAISGFGSYPPWDSLSLWFGMVLERRVASPCNN
jgi:hypothetical protein